MYSKSAATIREDQIKVMDEANEANEDVPF